MHPIAILWYLAVAQIPAPQGEWPVYAHDAGGSRYSPLTQVSRANVRDLRPAWTYRTGDLLHDRSRFEATPLMVDGTLYVSTPLGRVIALDPARGRERWRYDPRVDLHGDYGDFANRGVSTWLVHMTQLRHKLERDPTQPRYFLTEPGVSYRLRAD